MSYLGKENVKLKDLFRMLHCVDFQRQKEECNVHSNNGNSKQVLSYDSKKMS